MRCVTTDNDINLQSFAFLPNLNFRCMDYFQERRERRGGNAQAGGRPDQVLRGLPHLDCGIGYAGRGRETGTDWWVIVTCGKS